MPDYNSAQIGFDLSAPANLSIRIYDLAGRLRWSDNIASSATIVGYNKVSFDGKDNFGNYLDNDTYLVTVTAEDNGQKATGRHRLTIVR
jgi:flagellar hook assembly protein FlgD